MRKPFFNRHRLARRWRRSVETGALTTRDAAKSTRDFAWHRTKINPYYNNQGRGDWCNRLKIFGGLISLFLMLGILVYHPFFHITKLEIRGLTRIRELEFRNAVFGIMDYRKLFVLPGNNYILLNTNELHDILLERFPLQNVTIQKKFPNTLILNAQEKISTIIYDNGRQYSYLGMDGRMVEMIRAVGDDEWQHMTIGTTTTSTVHIPPVSALIKSMGDVPIVYDMKGGDGAPGDAMLTPDQVSGIVSWFNFLKTKTNISIAYFLIQDITENLRMKTNEGWDLLIRPTDDTDAQFNALQTFLKTHPKRQGMHYIDLRYPGRVYWQ